MPLSVAKRGSPGPGRATSDATGSSEDKALKESIGEEGRGGGRHR